MVEHVFLPPKLPQNVDDPHVLSHEASPLTIVVDGIQTFRTIIQLSHMNSIDRTAEAVHRFHKITQCNRILA